MGCCCHFFLGPPPSLLPTLVPFVVTVFTSAAAVIGFVVFALLFAVFLADVRSLCITLLILSISLKIMQKDSIGL
jgi:hypothetical protein